MSVDATIATWKLDKSISAIQKLLLLSLADRAGENAECWPGLKRLMKDTNLDRHTIVDNRKLLIEKGLIEFTGELKGRTKSVPVMRLTYVKSREGDYDENQEFISSVEMPTTSSVESNTAKQCGNAHSEPKRREPNKEPKNTTTSSSNIFESYKEKEKENLSKVNEEFYKQQLAEKFKTESLDDEQVQQIFSERFQGLNVTLLQLYEECADYWSQTNQQVYKARFITHLKKTSLDKYKDFKSIKSKSSITPDDKELIQTYCSLCSGRRTIPTDLNHKISILRSRLKMTDTAESREALASLSKYEEIAQSNNFHQLVAKSLEKKQISETAKSTLSELKGILR